MSPLREIRPSTEEERNSSFSHKPHHYLVDREVGKLDSINEAMKRGGGVATLVYEGNPEGTGLFDEAWEAKHGLVDEFKWELGKIIEAEIIDERGENGQVKLLIREFPHDSVEKK
jgi:hypothetical protein